MRSLTRSRAWDIAAAVADPELPALRLGELGVLRDVTEDDQGRVHVTVEPPMSPDAMDALRDVLVATLTCHGYLRVDVEFVPAPRLPA